MTRVVMTGRRMKIPEMFIADLAWRLGRRCPTSASAAHGSSTVILDGDLRARREAQLAVRDDLLAGGEALPITDHCLWTRRTVTGRASAVSSALTT